MESAEKQLEKLAPVIQAIHIEVKQLSTTLLGTPGTGDKGLVGEVKSNRECIDSLNGRQRKLSKNLWMLIGILTGSGILGTGIWSLLSGG